MVHISAAIGQFFGAIVKALFLSAGAVVLVGALAVVSLVGAFVSWRALRAKTRR
jgi:hypothetical protein